MSAREIMKFIEVILIATVLLNAAITDAKIYTRCELAKELLYSGIPKTFLSNCKLAHLLTQLMIIMSNHIQHRGMFNRGRVGC